MKTLFCLTSLVLGFSASFAHAVAEPKMIYECEGAQATKPRKLNCTSLDYCDYGTVKCTLIMIPPPPGCTGMTAAYNTGACGALNLNVPAKCDSAEGRCPGVNDCAKNGPSASLQKLLKSGGSQTEEADASSTNSGAAK